MGESGLTGRKTGESGSRSLGDRLCFPSRAQGERYRSLTDYDSGAILGESGRRGLQDDFHKTILSDMGQSSLSESL